MMTISIKRCELFEPTIMTTSGADLLTAESLGYPVRCCGEVVIPPLSLHVRLLAGAPVSSCLLHVPTPL